MKPFAVLQLTINPPFGGRPQSWEVFVPSDPKKDAEQFRDEAKNALTKVSDKLREQLPQ
ncbi:hypothetical protein [Devosia sp. DBB001]|nr:hypothetical protein [Devosia sp. DBB001]